jgi:hypothetical protein
VQFQKGLCLPCHSINAKPIVQLGRLHCTSSTELHVQLQKGLCLTLHSINIKSTSTTGTQNELNIHSDTHVYHNLRISHNHEKWLCTTLAEYTGILHALCNAKSYMSLSNKTNSLLCFSFSTGTSSFVCLSIPFTQAQDHWYHTSRLFGD